MAATQLAPGAWPGRRYGSFAGKASSTGTHPAGTLTQFHPSATPGRRYGNFAGKTTGAGPGPHPVGPLTQCTPGAWPGRRYGDFTGRASIDPEPPGPPGGGPVFGGPSISYRQRRTERRPTHRVVHDLRDEEEIVLILAILEQNDLL